MIRIQNKYLTQVGSLAALHLGKRGHKVDLYEYREDIRTAELVIGRSINLALSARGRKALAEVGLEDKLLEHGIPMYARMIHDLNGNRKVIPYDRQTHQAIYSVGRKYLNEILLNGKLVTYDLKPYNILATDIFSISNFNNSIAAEKYPNINLKFNKKLTSGKVENGELTFTE